VAQHAILLSVQASWRQKLICKFKNSRKQGKRKEPEEKALQLPKPAKRQRVEADLSEDDVQCPDEYESAVTQLKEELHPKSKTVRKLLDEIFTSWH